jgi:hypothetical protein
MRMEPLGAKTGSGSLSVFQAFVQDVSDSETRKWCGSAILEDPHFGSQVNVQFHAEEAEKLCRLRPDRAAALFSAFSRELNLIGFGELKITCP